jgi:hypothetical protein
LTRVCSVVVVYITTSRLIVSKKWQGNLITLSSNTRIRTL